MGGRVYLLLTLKLFVLEAINWLQRPLNSIHRLNCTDVKWQHTQRASWNVIKLHRFRPRCVGERSVGTLKVDLLPSRLSGHNKMFNCTWKGFLSFRNTFWGATTATRGFTRNLMLKENLLKESESRSTNGPCDV